MKINLDRMTNDPSYEHYAYKERPKRKVVTIPGWVWVATLIIFLQLVIK